MCYFYFFSFIFYFIICNEATDAAAEKPARKKSKKKGTLICFIVSYVFILHYFLIYFLFLNLFLSIIEKESKEINKAAEAIVTCCNTNCASWDCPKFQFFYCKGSLHEECFEEMLCSKSCVGQWRL
jgi:hypothetical protein